MAYNGRGRSGMTNGRGTPRPTRPGTRTNRSQQRRQNRVQNAQGSPRRQSSWIVESTGQSYNGRVTEYAGYTWTSKDGAYQGDSKKLISRKLPSDMSFNRKGPEDIGPRMRGPRSQTPLTSNTRRRQTSSRPQGNGRRRTSPTSQRGMGRGGRKGGY